MRFFSFFLTVLCSAALFSLGIPNEWLNFGYGAGFVAIIPLYYALLNCGSYKKAALLYGFFVVFVHLISSFWLAFFGDFAIFTLGASTIAYFVLALPFGTFFYYALQKDRRIRIFLFAGVWLMWEYFKSNGFVAYPWGTVCMTAFNLKYFIQFIDTTGVWGLSFVLSLFAACFCEILNVFIYSDRKGEFLKNLNPYKVPFVIVTGLFLMIMFYGFIVLNFKTEPKTYLNTVIVQQNGDPWDMNNFESYLKTSQTLSKREVSSAEEKPDLIVWSESSLTNSYFNSRFFYSSFPNEEPFLDFLNNVNVPVLAGSPIIDHLNRGYNSAILIAPDGNILEAYSKIQLVPFAEYIPFIEHPFVQKFFDRLVGFSAGWTPGKEFSNFSIENSMGEDIKFTVPICFEDAFPAVCSNLHNTGSELLINITNDSWSKTASAEYQHFVVSYFRTLELRTSLVRATNSGFSCVADPYGEVIASLPLFKADAMTVKVPVYSHIKTPYAVLGDWLPFFIFIILLKIIFNDWVLKVKLNAASILPNCHWKKIKPEFKKRVRRCKPLFAVKRKLKSKIR